MINELDSKSKYDAARDTVGKIYRDLHLNIPDERIEVGDMTNAMLPGLVTDINEGIASKPFGDKPWYIMIHEKKDLQMKEALLRRVLHFAHRPWPEDDTTVFWHDPIAGETRFCWSLPHWSEMDNMLCCYNLYDDNLIREIKAWKALDLFFFGFVKDDIGNWIPNPTWKDKPLGEPKIKIRAA
jgi:hypothetical protein